MLLKLAKLVMVPDAAKPGMGAATVLARLAENRAVFAKRPQEACALAMGNRFGLVPQDDLDQRNVVITTKWIIYKLTGYCLK